MMFSADKIIVIALISLVAAYAAVCVFGYMAA